MIVNELFYESPSVWRDDAACFYLFLYGRRGCAWGKFGITINRPSTRKQRKDWALENVALGEKSSVARAEAWAINRLVELKDDFFGKDQWPMRRRETGPWHLADRAYKDAVKEFGLETCWKWQGALA